jgi:hypothetical protein
MTHFWITGRPESSDHLLIKYFVDGERGRWRCRHYSPYQGISLAVSLSLFLHDADYIVDFVLLHYIQIRGTADHNPQTMVDHLSGREECSAPSSSR